MSRFLQPLVLLAMMISACACKSSRSLGDGWELLSEKKANHLFEKDITTVKTRDKFTGLQLYVERRDIEIKEVEIMLINGDVLKPAIEKRIVAGQRSSIIELAADGRQLDNILIRYKSQGKLFGKKGRLKIAGKRYDPNKKF